MKLALICFLLLAPPLLTAQNYLWPTNASDYLTSSFCEYRPGHYHSAIDIKTWNTEGYPVYAVDDAQIDKIRVSPFGYGKVIYLRLRDGRIAVYAHLQRFNDQLEESLKQRQIEQERYTITWHPKNRRVKRGDVIGYSGQTGIGVPHLHFEIRDRNEHPLNPLAFYDHIQDNIAPALQEIMVLPQDEFSAVNGSFLPQKYQLTHINSNIYVIKEPLRVRGKFALAIRGYDKADGVHNRFAFYRTRMTVNDKLLFENQYDRLDFAITNQIDLAIVYPERARTRKVFHKLFIDSANKLDFYDRTLGNGILKIDTDPLRVVIEVADYAGNLSYINATLLPDGVPPAQLTFLQKINDLAFVKLSLPQRLKELAFKSRQAGRDWKPVDYFELLERSFNDDQQESLLKVRLNDAEDLALKIIVTTQDNETIETVAALDNHPNSAVDLTITNAGKNLVLDYQAIQAVPGLNLTLTNPAGQRNITPQIINNHYQQIIPARGIQQGSLRVSLAGSDTVYSDTTLTYFPLLPGREQHIDPFDQRMTVTSEKTSLFDTLLCRFSETDVTDSLWEDPLFSKIFEIDWNGQILNRPLNVRLRPDSLSENTRQMGVYRISGSSRLSLTGSSFDSTAGTIGGRIKTPGRFIIAADTTAPEVTVYSPANGAVVGRNPKIIFSMKDNLSGIGSDRNIRVTIDGQFIIPEWDPERDRVTAVAHMKLTPGEHEVMIELKDSAGNITSEQRTIVVRQE